MKPSGIILDKNYDIFLFFFTYELFTDTFNAVDPCITIIIIIIKFAGRVICTESTSVSQHSILTSSCSGY